MPKTKEGSEYVCGICGTTLLVTECGDGYLEDIVCCAQLMKRRAARSAKAKHKKARRKK